MRAVCPHCGAGNRTENLAEVTCWQCGKPVAAPTNLPPPPVRQEVNVKSTVLLSDEMLKSPELMRTLDAPVQGKAPTNPVTVLLTILVVLLLLLVVLLLFKR